MNATSSSNVTLLVVVDSFRAKEYYFNTSIPTG